MILKLEARRGGAHTHVAVRMGLTVGSLPLAGSLTFRNDEWSVFRDLVVIGFRESMPLELELVVDEASR